MYVPSPAQQGRLPYHIKQLEYSFVVKLSLYGMQNMVTFSSPRQITHYINSREQKAANSMRFNPGNAVLAFCSSMDVQGWTCKDGCQVNDINLCAIVSSLGRVWMLAQQTRNFQHTDHKPRNSVEAVSQQSLQQLQPMVENMRPREASTILFAFALAVILMTLCQALCTH